MASVQTVKKFHEETGISVSKIKELIRQGVIHEVPRDHDDCMQLINVREFNRRLDENGITIPLSERSIKRLQNVYAEGEA
ncbi:hypothetical protein ACED34_18855 [Vibrio splendidus]|uniref:hypothetical protein n=1 Tax=Vibrio TaxID=662 RepID=UPI00104E2CD5|nr:hypothetical protein [Vibrio crassostreae]TCT60154.1 hypothetical protein EDB31_15422 [Vibrio crassostreae]